MITPEKLEQVARDVEVSDCATAGLLRAAARQLRALVDDPNRTSHFEYNDDCTLVRTVTTTAWRTA